MAASAALILQGHISLIGDTFRWCYKWPRGPEPGVSTRSLPTGVKQVVLENWTQLYERAIAADEEAGTGPVDGGVRAGAAGVAAVLLPDGRFRLDVEELDRDHEHGARGREVRGRGQLLARR